MTTENKKQSFWVAKDGKPQLVEGELIPEEEGSWCEGENRLHTTDGYCFISWFTTPKEVIEHEINTVQFKIEFETEMWEATLKDLKEEKEYWVKMLNNLGDKNE